MYIKNRRVSSKFKDYNPLQLLCNLTGRCKEVAYISYTNCYAMISDYHNKKSQLIDMKLLLNSFYCPFCFRVLSPLLNTKNKQCLREPQASSLLPVD